MVVNIKPVSTRKIVALVVILFAIFISLREIKYAQYLVTAKLIPKPMNDSKIEGIRRVSVYTPYRSGPSNLAIIMVETARIIVDRRLPVKSVKLAFADSVATSVLLLATSVRSFLKFLQ
jgi:hypothetical protein